MKTDHLKYALVAFTLLQGVFFFGVAIYAEVHYGMLSETTASGHSSSSSVEREDALANNLWRYALVFALLVVAVTWLLCDGVVQENRFQLLCYLVSLLLLLSLLSYEYFRARFHSSSGCCCSSASSGCSSASSSCSSPSLLLTVAFAVAWVCVPLDALLVAGVWRRCGWLAVERAGATAAALRHYTRLQQHDSLLKLDLLLCVVGVWLLALFFVHDYELYVALVVLLFSVAWAWLGHWVVRRRHGPSLAAEAAFGLFALVVPAYVIAKAVLAFTGRYRYGEVWLGPIVFEVVCVLLVRVILLAFTALLLWDVRRWRRADHQEREQVQVLLGEDQDEQPPDQDEESPLITSQLYSESNALLSQRGGVYGYSSSTGSAGAALRTDTPAAAPPPLKTLGEVSDSTLWDSQHDLGISRF
jgi:hypothetical protein